MKWNKRDIGSEYEQKAALILEEAGYKILQRNYFGKHGEIDVIAQKKDRIIFVEVKYRASLKYGKGEEAIDYNKMRRIYFTAKEYIYKKRLYEYEIRFDSISFFNDEVSWNKNIIWGDEIGL